MKKFATFIAGVCLAVAITTSAFAVDTVVTANSAPVVLQSTSVDTTSLFNAKEFGVSLASGYTVGDVGSVKANTAFTQPYALNFNAGVFYFPWRNLGVEANVPFYQSQGVSVSEVQFGTVLRVPLATETPLLRNIAPYVGLGGVYSWTAENDWAYIGKVGLEVRLNKSWGIFAEGQYRNDEIQNLNKGIVGLNGGLRLVF